MPLTVSFTTSQILGNPSVIIFTDTSTGTDVSVVSRRIYLQQYNAQYLALPGTTTSYIAWPLSISASISIDILQVDMAFNILVQWLDVSGNVLYAKTGLDVFNMYSKTYNDTLVTAQQADPAIVKNTNYWMNRMQLTLAISDAVISISEMSDVTNSQQACNRGTYLVENANMFF